MDNAWKQAKVMDHLKLLAKSNGFKLLKSAKKTNNGWNSYLSSCLWISSEIAKSQLTNKLLKSRPIIKCDIAKNK